MKNHSYLYLLFFLFILLNLKAQNRNWEFGMVAGGGGTYVLGQSQFLNPDQMRLNYTGQLFLQRNFTKNISVTLFSGYENKGGASQVSLSDANGVFIENTTADFHLNYLTFSPMFFYSTNGKTRFSFGVGPYSGFLLGSYLCIDKKQSDKGFFSEPNDLGFNLATYGASKISHDWFLKYGVRGSFSLLNIAPNRDSRGDLWRNSIVVFELGFIKKFGKIQK